MNNMDEIDLEIMSIIDNDTMEVVLEDKEIGEVIPVETPSTEVVNTEQESDDKFDVDFDYIRKNMKDIIKSGKEALERMIMVAEESEHPRAYEVVATLMKALSDVNKDLLSAHKHKDERVVNSGDRTTNIQNNTVFVGSTSELSKLLQQRRKEKEVN